MSDLEKQQQEKNVWKYVGVVIWKCRCDKSVQTLMRFEVAVKQCGLTECAAVYFGIFIPLACAECGDSLPF